MQICEKEEIWENGDDLFFAYTKVIWKSGDDFFFARTTLRLTSPINVRELEPVPIPVEHVRPRYAAELTLAPTPLPDDGYVKTTSLLDYSPDVEPPLSAVVLAEARICETLKKHPHPNVARYIGCITQGDRITGLCFTRYDKTLEHRLSDPDDTVERDVAVAIRLRIETVHSLGFTHNDLNPYNIMFQSDGTAV